MLLGQFDISVDGFPIWLKTLVWVAVGVAAVTLIWDKVHGRQIAQIILKELTTNGGRSMKDEVTKGMVDSREALKISKEIQMLQKEQYFHLDTRLINVEAGVEQLKTQGETVEQRVIILEKEFARFIQHTANDLNRSALLKDAERILGNSGG